MIFYQLEGRIINGKPYTKTFLARSPDTARKAAFHFLEHYLSILLEHDEIVLSKILRAEEPLETRLNRLCYEPINFRHPEYYVQGISVWMYDADSVHVDSVETPYLIYKCGDVSVAEIYEIINSLKFELDRYTQLDILTPMQAIKVDFSPFNSSVPKSENTFGIFDVYPTPVCWKKTHWLYKVHSESNGLLAGMYQTLETVSFIEKFDVGLLNDELISLSNTKGGFVYIGLNGAMTGKGLSKNQEKKIQQYFEKNSIQFLEQISDKLCINTIVCQGKRILVIEIIPKETAPIIMEKEKEIMCRDVYGFKILKTRKDFLDYYQYLDRLTLNCLYDLFGGHLDDIF